jgi:hypothetical protein
MLQPEKTTLDAGLGASAACNGSIQAAKDKISAQSFSFLHVIM